MFRAKFRQGTRTDIEVIMNRLTSAIANACLLGIALLLLAGVALQPACLLAQAAKSAASSGSGGSSAGVGFSIETEMLTYRALETNSEAIACDVAAFLHGTTADFKNPSPGAGCNISGMAAGMGAKSGVIILPFDRSVYGDFQLWRSDMQTMAEFERRGAGACAAEASGPGTSGPPRGRGLTSSASSASSGLSGAMAALTPAGSALSTASGVLGLFASTHDAAPVGGTIEDQAFMDNVSRALRGLGVFVLMPSIYTPYGLTSIDAVRSPFLTSLDAVLHTRDCLVASKGAADSDVKNIDGFLAALSAAPAKPAASQQGGGSSGGGGGTGASMQSSESAPSHLDSVLSADGLAQQLGADPVTGKIPDSAPQHVLLIKALESGGSVNHSSNIFGSKMSYSGGSVGTYALFGLNGQVECSGNVYNYATTSPKGDFNKQLLNYAPNPAGEVIFSHGGCGAH
jgi:hypothetical protein